MSEKKNMVVTVSLNEEEIALLEERIEYLKEQRGVGSRVTKAEAIRHAICQTSYRRKKNGEN
ncbi:hypothetical protein IJ425_08740 [bacterium]|nr:hypothetical protein [bacterium]